ncbi:GNAT family N-acetyltransferase [Myroides sp. BIT-d1]|uniref:GNAT family N-acetyltransferase n=1 Tax=Myroides albus TaxID=2562892 RepID=A0A6I3LLP9_9FLAO|nr:GNAT family N-acetyltransferase [Myroides albus]MTG99283.1 GNAT family N-acetyltransferase [Myroides albus]
MNRSKIDFNQIPWDRLVHWEGRAHNIPALIQVIERGSTHEQRMALVTLANQIEQKGGLVISTPIVVAYLLERLTVDSNNQDLILRVLLKVAKAIGLQWEVFINTTEFDGLSFGEDIWSQHSKYLWPPYLSQVEDDALWASLDPVLFYDHAWFYTRELLIANKESIFGVRAKDGIEQCLIYDLETIINMVKDQQRNIVSIEDFSYEIDHLKFVPISNDFLYDIYDNLTEEVSKYLSFDPVKNIEFTKEYIRSSRVEFERGAAMVLVVLDTKNNEFVGSCGIHDINDETVELGLWLKESKQGKGLGTIIVQAMLNIVKENIKTRTIIYSVEEANEYSSRLPIKFGFQYVYDFIVEPSVLKNRLRRMQQFRLQL